MNQGCILKYALILSNIVKLTEILVKMNSN